MTEFAGFPKIPRYQRDIIITEKIDGTNAQIYIEELKTNAIYVKGVVGALWNNQDYAIYAGSRTRWITPGDDNFGFAKWAKDNAEELLRLGVGRHFGEWWGKGIQRGYGLGERRFSLFNTSRWGVDELPKCCHVVPVLYRGPWMLPYNDEGIRGDAVTAIFDDLQRKGSMAAPGFMKPEGIVIYHTAGNLGFKMTYEKDDTGKRDE